MSKAREMYALTIMTLQQDYKDLYDKIMGEVNKAARRGELQVDIHLNSTQERLAILTLVKQDGFTAIGFPGSEKVTIAWRKPDEEPRPGSE